MRPIKTLSSIFEFSPAGAARPSWLRHAAPSRCAIYVTILVALSTLRTGSAEAATYYWDTTTTGLFSDGANWSASPTGSPAGGTAPSVTDSAVFNGSSVNGAETVQLSGAAGINGITFANTGTTLIDSSTTTSEPLTIGTGGILINPGAGAVTIGNASNAAPITLGGAESWVNNSGTILTIVNGVTNAGHNLTVSGSGAGGVTIPGGVSGTGGVIETVTGTGALTLSGVNSFTGGITITSGTMNLTGNQSGVTGNIAVDTLATGGAASQLNIGSTSQSAATQLTINAANTVQAGPYSGGASVANTIALNGASGHLTSATNNGTLILGRGSNLNLLTYSNWTQAGPMTLADNGGYSARILVDTNTTFSYTGTSAINFGSTSTGVSGANGDSITVNGAAALFTTGQGIDYALGGLDGFVTLEGGGTLKLTANVPSFVTYGPNGTVPTTGTNEFMLGSGSGGIVNTNGFFTSISLPFVNVSGQAGALTKAGSGTLVLGASNSFTGGTTVTGGTLTAVSALGTNSGLTVSAGAFNYEPLAAGPLNLGTGKITLAAGATIGAALGGTPGQSAITSSAAATTAGNITVNIIGVPTAPVTDGVNNLITAASGLNSATYTLGAVYNATNFTLGSIASSATAVSITAVAQTALTSEYYAGGFTGGSNVLAISDGNAASNWSSTPLTTGTAITPLTPGSTATIYFTPGETNQSSVVLGAGMSVLGAQFSDMNAVTLAADGNTLTLGAGGVTVNAGAGTVTLNTPLTISGTETWTNNSTNPLLVGGVISGSGAALNIAGSGTTVLTGVNSFNGGLNIQSGILQVGTQFATGVNTLTFGTAVSSGTLDLNGLTVNVAGLAIAPGAQPGSQVIGNSSQTTPATLNFFGGTTTFGATIQDSLGSGNQTTGLTIGAGTLTLSGSSTYSGPTQVKAGTLFVSGSLSGNSTVTVGNASSLTTAATFGGSGTVGNVVVGAAAGDAGARLRPSVTSTNTGMGVTLTTGSLLFTDGSAHLNIQLGRTLAFTAGGGDGAEGGDVSDHVDAAGPITLNNADLTLSLLSTTGYSIASGDVFFLIINGSGSPINGTFGSINGVATTLTEGSAFTYSGQQYMITYLANFAGNSFTGGNDVALEAIPEPAGNSLAILFGTGVLMLVRRKRYGYSVGENHR